MLFSWFPLYLKWVSCRQNWLLYCFFFIKLYDLSIYDIFIDIVLLNLLPSYLSHPFIEHFFALVWNIFSMPLYFHYWLTSYISIAPFQFFVTLIIMACLWQLSLSLFFYKTILLFSIYKIKFYCLYNFLICFVCFFSLSQLLSYWCLAYKVVSFL